MKDLEHTRGADRIFVDLIDAARRRAQAGRDDALVEWRSAAPALAGTCGLTATASIGEAAPSTVSSSNMTGAR